MQYCDRGILLPCTAYIFNGDDVFVSHTSHIARLVPHATTRLEISCSLHERVYARVYESDGGYSLQRSVVFGSSLSLSLSLPLSLSEDRPNKEKNIYMFLSSAESMDIEKTRS